MLSINLEPITFELDEDYIDAQLAQLGSRSVGEIDTLMRNTPRTGRLYGNHRASSGGSAPAVDTGRLRQSVGFDAGRAVVKVGAGAEYAGYLQDGTQNIAPRPYLDRGIDKAIADWPEFMSDFVVLEE